MVTAQNVHLFVDIGHHQSQIDIKPLQRASKLTKLLFLDPMAVVVARSFVYLLSAPVFPFFFNADMVQSDLVLHRFVGKCKIFPNSAPNTCTNVFHKPAENTSLPPN